MDANTVQEIVNQLGVGVDQILQYLPAYAQTQFMGMLIPIIIGCVLLLIGIVGFIVSAVLKSKWYNLHIEYNNKTDLYTDRKSEDYRLYKKYSKLDDIGEIMMWAFGVFTAIIFICLMIGVPLCIGPMIGWSTSPELMLLKSLIPN